MDELIESMVNRQQREKLSDMDARFERKLLDKSSELFEKAIDAHLERFGENVDRVVSRKRSVEDGPNNEHYGEMTLEPIDVAQHWLGNEQIEGAYLFQIIKYLGRYRMNVQGKGGKIDLLKMRDYLNLLIEMKDEC